MRSLPDPPVARRVPHRRLVHGDAVTDEYAWLLNREDPDAAAYLEAEDAYCAATSRSLEPIRDAIFREIRERAQETDMSVPVRSGRWWYYGRTGEAQRHPVRARRPVTGPAYDPSAPEQVVLDANGLAGESPYLALGTFDVSPSGSLLAYSTDRSGAETFTLRVRDIASARDAPDTIDGTSYGTAWSLDETALYYVTADEAGRPCRVWRHRLGTPPAADELLYEEADGRFRVAVSLTRSRRWVLLHVRSHTTGEVWALPAGEAGGRFRVIAPRRDGVEYRVDHQGDRFLIVSNHFSEDFALLQAPAADPRRERWEPVWSPAPGTTVLGVEAFASHLVAWFRRDAQTGLRVMPNLGDAHEIPLPDPVRSVGPRGNPEFDATQYRLSYTSPTTPASVYDYDVGRRSLTLLRREPVREYDPSGYDTAREWASAPDGTRVPISLVWRRGTPRDGSAPCLLEAYGSYGACVEPHFSIARLSLLDRGFVCAMAHVRGGGELGRAWHRDAVLLRKRTTFTDFIACADHLVARGWTSPRRLAALGRSAGGLLTGAVANLAPERFGAIVAQVPFVDPLNTMLRPSLPLTSVEREEWGDPLQDPDVYACMKSYSPFENVGDHAYPPMLVTAALNDARVGWAEPARWVARLRAVTGARERLRLRLELGPGHLGASAHHDAWREAAFALAFLVDTVGRR
jgi:oligopeptidase B